MTPNVGIGSEFRRPPRLAVVRGRFLLYMGSLILGVTSALIRISLPATAPLDLPAGSIMMRPVLLPDFSVETPAPKKPDKRPGLPSVIEHRVRRGETLTSISRLYGVSLHTILGANRALNPRRLRPGQKVNVLAKDGVNHTVRRGQTMIDISMTYKVKVKEILKANGVSNANKIRIGQKLFIPGGRPLPKKTRLFIRPAKGRISSGYGYRTHPVFKRRHFHSGVDIAGGWNGKIRAAAAGKVKFRKWRGGYGRLIIIKHPGGYETYYGQCNEYLVTVGQYVEQGQAIGRIGSTGTSTGPHLHFEIRKNGRYINPTPHIRSTRRYY